MYRRIFSHSITAALIAGIAFMASGCASKTTREGRSPAYLIVNSIEGAPGSDPDTFRTPLSSDVLTNNSVINDLGRAEIVLALRDIGQPGSPTTPTSNNAVTLSRYHVEYTRSDGRNTPGVDVPYGFDGAVTVTIASDQAVDVPFEAVRVQAKEEAPLRALRGLGGAVAISTLANVTFFGRDQVGNEVVATGTLQVNFADWADEDSSN
jgi:hypothetical protein